jgi:predicted DCC family thiol-disulfide oxidoreductase YuxK
MFGYFASKRAAQRIVEDSGLPWTTMRATQYHDSMLIWLGTWRRCRCTIRLIAMAERPLQLTLVFDGTCGFCTRSVRLLEALDRNRRVTAVPFQKSSVPASVGLTLQECKAAAWAIASDGGRYRGAEAVNAVVAAALGSTLPLLLYSLPGIRQLLDFIYYLVASNRSRLPGDPPYCSQHPAECR